MFAKALHRKVLDRVVSAIIGTEYEETAPASIILLIAYELTGQIEVDNIRLDESDGHPRGYLSELYVLNYINSNRERYSV
jgi:hypothetical protein